MPEAEMVQTKFYGLRDQSFWKGRREGLQAEGSGGGFGLLPRSGRTAESFRRAVRRKECE